MKETQTLKRRLSQNGSSSNIWGHHECLPSNVRMAVTLMIATVTICLSVSAQTTSVGRDSGSGSREINRLHIPDPKCKPWQTVMWGDFRDGEEPRRKWCETDSSRGYPSLLNVVRAYLPYWGTARNFRQNFWRVDVKPQGSVSGDFYIGWADVVFRNVNGIPPYRSEYHYTMSVTQSNGIEIKLKRKEK